MKFRPCIDLHEGVVKQIVGGTLSDADGEGGRTHPATNFVSPRPPSYFAHLYHEDGLTGGHVIMLGPGNEAAAMDALAAWPGGLQVGGGITAENASLWLDRGAAAVIVTSFVFRDGTVERDRLRSLVDAVGKDRLVLDLSCRKRHGQYYIVTDRWQKFTHEVVDRSTLNELSRSCTEFLVHAADVEGLCAGIDEELVSILAQHSPIPTTYAGGVRDMEDVYRVERLGTGRIDITVGSALDIFGGSGGRYRDLVDHSCADVS